MITLADLERMGACEGAKEAFEERFPCGASRRELLLALVEHEQGWDWFMWLTECTSKFEDIARAFEVARKSNQEAFVTSLKPANHAWQVANQPLWCGDSSPTAVSAYNKADKAYETAYKLAVTTRSKAYREAIRAIAESLPEVEVTA